jgi:RND family efflux transporter MFP subunit
MRLFGKRQPDKRPVPEASGAVATAAKPRRRWLGPLQIAIVLALLLAAFLYARAPGRDAGEVPEFADAEGDLLPIVRVTRPVPSATKLRVDATGTVHVRNHIALTPLVGGRVVSISPSLRAGGAFIAGEALLVIDRKDYELALDQARAEIASAQSTLMLQRAESDAARANYALLNPGERVPPLVARIPQIAQASAQLSAAEARTAIAALDLERTGFSLPFAGRVAESTAEVGQVLARGQSFGRAYALDAVEVAVPVAAEELERIAPAIGRSASVRVGRTSLAAKVERVSAELDERTRFAQIYLSFQLDEGEPGAVPTPGTFVNVVVEGPEVASTFLLPPGAEQIGRSVWVVADGALEQIVPRTLANNADGWVVAAFDFKDGVVLGAVPGAEPGLPVDIGTAAAERLGG